MTVSRVMVAAIAEIHARWFADRAGLVLFMAVLSLERFFRA